MTTSNSHQNAPQTDPRVEAYTQYRDTLIQHLFVSKALRFLNRVESLEGTADPALRARSEARRQRLTERLAKLRTILARFRSSPLTDYRKKNTGPVLSGGSGAAAASCVAPWLPTTQTDAAPLVNVNGLPMMGAVDVLGNPYGVTTDSLADSGMASTTDDWLSSRDMAPAVNVNGLPMVGATDIHGNAYGTTTFDTGHGF
nr:hypothetical protein [uncultured Pseudogulbenkiania sp.]